MRGVSLLVIGMALASCSTVAEPPMRSAYAQNQYQRLIAGKVAGAPLSLIQVVGQVFRDEAVKQHAQYVGLEVPAVHGPTEVVGDPPDRLVELCTFGGPGIGHRQPVGGETCR